VDYITQARIAAENLFSDHQLFMGLQFTWVAQGCLVQQFQGYKSWIIATFSS
jgi:hypothetical protein